MKHQIVRYHQITMVLLFVLLSSGCHTGRLSGMQHTQRNIVSSQAVTHSDSLSLLRQLQTTCDQKIRIEHLEFSPPDSLKRQYIHSITRMVSDEQVVQTDSIIQNDIQQTGINRQKSEREEVDRPIDTFSYKLFVGLVLVVILLVLLKTSRSIYR